MRRTEPSCGLLAREPFEERQGLAKVVGAHERFRERRFDRRIAGRKRERRSDGRNRLGRRPCACAMSARIR